MGCQNRASLYIDNISTDALFQKRFDHYEVKGDKGSKTTLESK